MLCRAVFRAAAAYREMLHMTIQLSSEETGLLAEVTKACHAGIDRALESPSEALVRRRATDGPCDADACKR